MKQFEKKYAPSFKMIQYAMEHFPNLFVETDLVFLEDETFINNNGAEVTLTPKKIEDLDAADLICLINLFTRSLAHNCNFGEFH